MMNRTKTRTSINQEGRIGTDEFLPLSSYQFDTLYIIYVFPFNEEEGREEKRSRKIFFCPFREDH